MLRRFYSVFATLLALGTATAQIIFPKYEKYPLVYKDISTGLYGVRDQKSEKIVPSDYESVDINRDMKIIVLARDGKCGVVDFEGRELLPLVYDNVGGYVSPEYFAMSRNGRWGIVDHSNRTVIPFEHQGIKFIYSGDDIVLAIKDDYRWALVSYKDFKPITRFKYEEIVDQQSMRHEPLSPITGSKESPLIGVLENGRWGFVDASGNVVIEPQFAHDDFMGLDCPLFINGHAIVQKGENFGIIDESGRALLPFNYTDMGYPLGGNGSRYIRASLPGYDELYDIDLNMIAAFPAARFMACGDSIAHFLRNNGSEILYDIKNQRQVPIPAGAKVDFLLAGQDRIMVSRNGKWGCIDRTGKPVFNYKYDEVSSYCRGAARVRRGNYFGFVKLDGTPLTPLCYEDAYDFGDDGLAMVKKGGKYSLINAQGEIVTPSSYDYVDSYPEETNGFYYRKVGEKKFDTLLYGYVDANGQKFIDFVPEWRARYHLERKLFRDGHIKLQQLNKK